jgi:hypothetical protein
VILEVLTKADSSDPKNSKKRVNGRRRHRKAGIFPLSSQHYRLSHADTARPNNSILLEKAVKE